MGRIATIAPVCTAMLGAARPADAPNGNHRLNGTYSLTAHSIEIHVATTLRQQAHRHHKVSYYWMMRVVGLVFCAVMAWGQRPSDADATALIEKSREKALAYAHSLPDFVCTELIHRYSAYPPDRRPPRSSGTMSPTLTLKWTPTDKLTLKLSYFQQQEEHKLVLLNDRPTDQKYETLTGGIIVGEFGGTLQSIFDPATATSFQWGSWKNLRRHHAAVYTYKVDVAHSRYTVGTGTAGSVSDAIVGFHGILEVDRETGEVLHFTYVTDDIPKRVKLDAVITVVDYDFADVGGRSYLLPSHCETEIHSPELSAKNDMEFREYRKFSADSTIEFGKVK
jgi:hypothetical protein